MQWLPCFGLSVVGRNLAIWGCRRAEPAFCQMAVKRNHRQPRQPISMKFLKPRSRQTATDYGLMCILKYEGYQLLCGNHVRTESRNKRKISYSVNMLVLRIFVLSLLLRGVVWKERSMRTPLKQEANRNPQFVISNQYRFFDRLLRKK